MGVWNKEMGVGLKDDGSAACMDVVEPAYAVQSMGISGRVVVCRCRGWRK